MSKLTKEWLLQSLSDLEKERNLVPGFQNHAVANAFDALSLALAALEANGGWIKCSDLLPGPNISVLVSNGVWVGIGMYSDETHIKDDERWRDEHQEIINLRHHPVTHWMPLPAAPQVIAEDFATKVQAELSRDGGEPKK